MNRQRIIATDTPLWQAAWKLYIESFPACERRDAAAQRRAMAHPEYRATVATDRSGAVEAILFYWERADMIYVEHLAVNPALRGRQIGSRLLEEFVREKAPRRVMLEIDPPEDEISRRRLRFYERLGFVMNDFPFVHPSYAAGAGAQPHELKVLSYGEPLSPAEFERFAAYALHAAQV